MPLTGKERKNRKVNIMDEVNWESVKMKVNSCIEGDVDGTIPDDVRSIATMLIEKAMLKDFPSGKVVWRRGNQGLLPAAASVVVDSAAEAIREAAYAFFESTSQYSQPLLRKHGKSAGPPVFTDANDYANTLAKKAKQTARELYKDGSWDGSLDGLAACAEYDFVEEEE